MNTRVIRISLKTETTLKWKAMAKNKGKDIGS